MQFKLADVLEETLEGGREEDEISWDQARRGLCKMLAIIFTVQKIVDF